MLSKRLLAVRTFARFYSNSSNCSNSSNSSNEILYEKRDDKAVVTLNRPKQLNAFSVNFQRQLIDAFNEIRRDNQVKLVILKSNGDKAFSAGGDLKGLYVDLDSEEHSPPLLTSITKCLHPAWAQMATIEKPVISLVNGICMGGGCGLALLPKYSVLTDRVTMSMPEVAIGHWTDAASSYYFGQLPNNIGMLMALTAAKFTAAELIEYGLKKHFTTSDKIDTLEGDLLQLTNCSHEAVGEVLSSYHIKPTIENKLDLAKINRIFGGESVEEIIDNLRKDDTDWARKLLARMSTYSPMSMKVSFFVNRMSQQNKFRAIDALKFDNTLCINFYASHERRADFREGIKSLFQKSRPNWNPSSLDLIDDLRVKSFFEPLHEIHAAN